MLPHSVLRMSLQLTQQSCSRGERASVFPHSTLKASKQTNKHQTCSRGQHKCCHTARLERVSKATIPAAGEANASAATHSTLRASLQTTHERMYIPDINSFQSTAENVKASASSNSNIHDTKKQHSLTAKQESCPTLHHHGHHRAQQH